MIHYHGGPLSGPKDSCQRFWRMRHAMVSFAYPDQLALIAEVCRSFVLDNGAFSTWRIGKPFDVAGYREFVDEWRLHPSFAWCLIPDVIDGNAKDNDAMIQEWTTSYPGAVTASVPVWHFHESPDRLRALANRFPIVALGSSGQWPTPGTDDWWDRLGECLPVILDSQRRPLCKLHGLRMLSSEIVPGVPFASADSTNAAQNAGRNGPCKLSEAWQRANYIADWIEGFNAPAVWSRERTELAIFSV